MLSEAILAFEKETRTRAVVLQFTLQIGQIIEAKR
jgi:hypothetical protein